MKRRTINDRPFAKGQILHINTMIVCSQCLADVHIDENIFFFGRMGDSETGLIYDVFTYREGKKCSQCGQPFIYLHMCLNSEVGTELDTFICEWCGSENKNGNSHCEQCNAPRYEKQKSLSDFVEWLHS